MKKLLLAIPLLCFSLFAQAADLTPVPSVDVSRYLGDWYQIAHIPLIFEGLSPCACARQRLTAGSPAGTVDVLNTCNKGDANGKLRSITGTATATDASNAKFAIDFHLPWKGSYWIIALDPDYRYAVVSDAHKLSLYILSKTPTLSEDLYQEAVGLAAKQLDTSRLQITDQTFCKYPQ